MTKVLRLAAFPSRGEGNPYIENFYHSLCVDDIKLVHTQGSAKVWLEDNIDRYDAVHFHWLIGFYNNPSLGTSLRHAFTFIKLIRWLRKNNKKVIFTLHNLLPHESRSRVVDVLVRFAILHQSDLVIVHSKSAKKQARQFFLKFSNIVVMPHGHYINNYKNTISAKEARHKLGISETDQVLLFLGAIMSYKGVHNLVTAVKKLNQANVKLIVAGRMGQSEYSTELRHSIDSSDRVKLYEGFIDDDDLQTYFNASDLVVLPFSRSLSSGSLLLAYSFYKPVLMPNNPSLLDFAIPELTYQYSDSLENAIMPSLCDIKQLDLDHVKTLLAQYDWDICVTPVRAAIIEMLE